MAPPFFCGTVETKEIPHAFFDGKGWLSVRAVKIDQEGLFSSHQNVLKLKVGMEKTSLVKLSNQKADRSNRFSLRRNTFNGKRRCHFVQILNQIHSVGYFDGKKISLIEWKKDRMVDGADGGNRRNSAGPDFFC